MKSIILEVDDEVEKAWKNGSPSLKAIYEDKISVLLKEFKETEEYDEVGLTKEQRDFLNAEAAKNTEIFEWWNDEEFVAELDKRSANLESGKDKGMSWEEAKFQILSKGRKNAV